MKAIADTEKQRLIKQIIREGLLPNIALSLIATGLSDKGLEIAQLTLYNRMIHKFRRQILPNIEQVKANVEKRFATSTVKQSDTIWVLWFQGIENAPEVVKKCYESLLKYCPQKKIVLLSEENLNNYISLPKYVEDKYQQGIISRTHYSDIVRTNLLTTYGGTWIDSTVLLTAQPDSFYFDSDLFLFQTLSPGSSGQAIPFSSWFITAQKPNRILLMTEEFLYQYWKNNNRLMDYFTYHYFLKIASEYYPDEYSLIPPVSNETPQLLLNRLDNPYSEPQWEFIKSQSPIHKVTYKNTPLNKGTYYQAIFKN